MVTGTETAKRVKTKRIVARSTGRPTKNETGRIRDSILDVAAVLFFAEGYGATSIEAVARKARISKRTLYHRFDDKPALFRAVVHKILQGMRPANVDGLFEGANLRDILHKIARIILHAALSPDAIALQRIVIAEAKRFPELALIMNEQGMRGEAITRIATLLEHMGGIKSATTRFAAEQFLHMVTSVPQRRAFGMGQPMDAQELEAWAANTVNLFLDGYKGSAT